MAARTTTFANRGLGSKAVGLIRWADGKRSPVRLPPGLTRAALGPLRGGRGGQAPELASCTAIASPWRQYRRQPELRLPGYGQT